MLAIDKWVKSQKDDIRVHHEFKWNCKQHGQSIELTGFVFSTSEVKTSRRRIPSNWFQA